jgi:hypothetical protein
MPGKKIDNDSAKKSDKKKVANKDGDASEKKSGGGVGKKLPKRAETYSVYIYRVLK